MDPSVDSVSCELAGRLLGIARAWQNVAQIACADAGFGLFAEVIDGLSTVQAVVRSHLALCLSAEAMDAETGAALEPVDGLCSASGGNAGAATLVETWRSELCTATIDTPLGRERRGNVYAGILCGGDAPAGFLRPAPSEQRCPSRERWADATLCIAEVHSRLGSNVHATYALAYPDRHPLHDAMHEDRDAARAFLREGPLSPSQRDELVASTARMLANATDPEDRRLALRLRIARVLRRLLGTPLQYEAPPWRELLALLAERDLDENARSLVVVMLLVQHESSETALQVLRAGASMDRLDSAMRGYAWVWDTEPSSEIRALIVTAMFHGVRTAIDSREYLTARTLLGSALWRSSDLSRRQHALARAELAAAQRAPARRWLEEAAGCRAGEALHECIERQIDGEAGAVARAAATRLMSTWDVRRASAEEASPTTLLMAVAAGPEREPPEGLDDPGSDLVRSCMIHETADWDCFADALEVEARRAAEAVRCFRARQDRCDAEETDRTLHRAADAALTIARMRPSPGWATSRVERTAARVDWAIQSYIAMRCRAERGRRCAAAAEFFRTALCLNSPDLRSPGCASARPARSTIEVQFHVYRDVLNPALLRGHVLSRREDVTSWSEIDHPDFLLRRATSWVRTLGARDRGDRALGAWLWREMFEDWMPTCSVDAPCAIEVAVDGGLGSLPFDAMDAGRGYVVADRVLRVTHVVDFDPAPTPTRWSQRLWVAPSYGRAGLGGGGLLNHELERAALEVTPVTGEADLRVALRRELPDVLHVSAHTLLDEHGMLQLLLDDADPRSFGLGFRERGLVSGAELQTLLTPERGAGAWLVFLAGCRTSFSDGIRLGGLTGAARVARASRTENMIASLWDVDDEATARLAQMFYASVRSGVPAEDALRAAQRAFAMGDAAPDRRWTSPRYWAAFIAIRNGLSDGEPTVIP